VGYGLGRPRLPSGTHYELVDRAVLRPPLHPTHRPGRTRLARSHMAVAYVTLELDNLRPFEIEGCGNGLRLSPQPYKNRVVVEFPSGHGVVIQLSWPRCRPVEANLSRSPQLPEFDRSVRE